jgi:hypothetical protein
VSRSIATATTAITTHTHRHTAVLHTFNGKELFKWKKK